MKKSILFVLTSIFVTVSANAQFHAGIALDAGAAPEMNNAYVSLNAEGFYSIDRVDLDLGIGIGATTKDGQTGTVATYHRTNFVPLYFHAQYNIPNTILFVNTNIGYSFSFGEKAYELEVMPVDTKLYERQMLNVRAVDYYKGLNESRNGFFFKLGFGFIPVEHLDVYLYAGLATWNKCSILNVSKINADGTPVYQLDENGNRIELKDENGQPMIIRIGYTLNNSIYAYWKGVIRDTEIANNPDIQEEDLWVNQLPDTGWEALVYDYVVNTLGYGENLKGDPAYGRKGLYDPVYDTRYKTETERKTYSQKAGDNVHYAPSNPLRYMKMEIGFSIKYSF